MLPKIRIFYLFINYANQASRLPQTARTASHPFCKAFGTTRAKRRAEALWRGKALKRAETLRDTKAHTPLAQRAHACGYGVQNEPYACKLSYAKQLRNDRGG